MSSRDGPRVLLGCDFHLKYCANLARGLARRGASPVLLTRDHGIEYGDRPEVMREQLARRLDPGVPVWWLPGRVREPRGLLAAASLRRRARHLDPAVVHVQEGLENDLRLAWATRLRPGRYALTIHDPTLHPGDAAPGAVRRAAASELLRRAGLVFVHGEALRDELVRLHAPRAPVEVVPHGAEAPAVAPMPDRPTVLFFGRIVAYKGLEVLLDAMPAVWEAVPDARLVVAGAGALPVHAVLDDARTSVRPGHVPEDELPELLAQSTCVALPYVQASQSGVGAVAKSHGRGLVVSAVGGLPELVADGSGVAVAAGEATALAGALADVLGTPERAAALGAAAAGTAGASAGWDEVAARTLEAYRRHRLLS